MNNPLNAAYLSGRTPDALWDLGDASGSTMRDVSGNAHDGSYSGSPTLGSTGVDLDSDTAVAFPGNVANYGSVPAGSWMDRTATLGLGIWFKTTSSAAQFMVQRWEDSGGSAQIWGMDLQASDVIRNYIRLAGVNRIASTTIENLRDGNWHLAGMDYDGASMDLLVDGRYVSRQAFTGSLLTGSGIDVYVGRRNGNGTSPFNGSLAKAYFGDPLGEQGWLNLYQRGMRKRTRFYFPSSTTQSMTPAFDSMWEQTGSAARRLMVTTKSNTALAGTSISDSAATGTEDVLHRQYIAVNNPFTRHGTLSGTFSFAMRPSEGNAAADAYLQIVVKIIKPDGTLRGVAYAGHTATTVVTTGGAVNCELPTGNQSRYLLNIALTDTAYQAGDILVVELGARYNQATATTYTTAVRTGDPTGTVEHTMTNADAADRVPFIEFSQELPVEPRDGWGIAA